MEMNQQPGTTTNKMSGDLVGTTADSGIHQAGALSRYSTTERESLRALAGLDEASDGDLDMLGMVAERTGLDPFLKEVYLVGRKTKVGGYRGEPERWVTKWTVQAGIDGFRKVLFRAAAALGKSHAIDEATYYDENGIERRIWLKSWGYPAAARVEVRIGDSIGVGLATWDEFVQTKRDGKPNSMWEKMGPTMLAKCAEAQAHRRVNSLTAGMYVPEEISDDQPLKAQSTRMDRPAQRRGGVSALERAKAKPQPQPEPEESTPEVDPAVQDGLEAISAAADLDELKAVMEGLGNAGAPEEVWEVLRSAANDRHGELNG